MCVIYGSPSWSVGDEEQARGTQHKEALWERKKLPIFSSKTWSLQSNSSDDKLRHNFALQKIIHSVAVYPHCTGGAGLELAKNKTNCSNKSCFTFLSDVGILNSHSVPEFSITFLCIFHIGKTAALGRIWQSKRDNFYSATFWLIWKTLLFSLGVFWCCPFFPLILPLWHDHRDQANGEKKGGLFLAPAESLWQ